MSHLKPFKCNRCGKKFGSKLAVNHHVTKKHHYGAAEKIKPRPFEPEDESMADRAVQAEIDRACGIENDDIEWLLP